MLQKRLGPASCSVNGLSWATSSQIKWILLADLPLRLTRSCYPLLTDGVCPPLCPVCPVVGQPWNPGWRRNVICERCLSSESWTLVNCTYCNCVAHLDCLRGREKVGHQFQFPRPSPVNSIDI